MPSQIHDGERTFEVQWRTIPEDSEDFERLLVVVSDITARLSAAPAYLDAVLATLGRPAGDPERSVLPIAGDDAAAKAAVTAFLDAIGYDALDVGPLAEGWRFQRDMPAYTAPYFAGTDPNEGRPVGREELSDRLEPGWKPGLPILGACHGLAGQRRPPVAEL